MLLLLRHMLSWRDQIIDSYGYRLRLRLVPLICGGLQMVGTEQQATGWLLGLELTPKESESRLNITYLCP
jgi:hypothetical protein